jgi:hypothetical protein
MHGYQRQDSSMTLAEGLAEYHASLPTFNRSAAMPREAREFFHCHDVAHVVFGCDTSLRQEAVVKLASILGTTAGLSVLRGYALDDSFAIYSKLSIGDVLTTIAASLIAVPRTVFRCLRQRKRWPWSRPNDYLNVSLRDIRAEFGIRV